jgi:hypothetical protein
MENFIINAFRPKIDFLHIFFKMAEIKTIIVENFSWAEKCEKCSFGCHTCFNCEFHINETCEIALYSNGNLTICSEYLPEGSILRSARIHVTSFEIEGQYIIYETNDGKYILDPIIHESYENIFCRKNN